MPHSRIVDTFFEYLVPILVFVVWAASQFLGNRNKDQSQEEAPDQGEQDEETRRIQEDIRRKIAERRQQQQEQEAPERQPQPVRRTSEPPPLRPSPYSTSPMGRGTGFPPPPNSVEPARFEVPPPQRNLAAELAEQEKRLRESQRVAEEARKQTEASLRQARARKTPFPTPAITLPSNTQAAVLAALRDPQAARQAIVLHEILGTPVGLRREGEMRRPWDN